MEKNKCPQREKRKRINCFQCEYYFVTWEKHLPHGCKAFGFKSREFPSTAVFNSSQRNCLLFRSKNNG